MGDHEHHGVDVEHLGDQLYEALRARSVVDPLVGRVHGLSIYDAYHVSERILERRLADGEVVVGRKIGVTSPAVQGMLGVHQPDFGTLTDAMQRGGEMSVSELIQPRCEAEIAVVLGADLIGPGVTPEQVLAAIDSVHPCFEVVDSRIRDWRIAIQDTIADNASSGLFTLGDGVPPDGVDWEGCLAVVTKNGAELSRGVGANTVGSPLKAVAWLANTLGRFGVPLCKGEIVLTGSLVALEPAVAGDEFHVSIDGVGECRLRFTE